jgi:trehalose/maltose hydrolase-like predicted phosphorylase
VRAVNFVRQSHPADFERLVERTRLDLKELDAWERAADRMYLPIDERIGIHPRTTASSTSRDGNAQTFRSISTRCCSITIHLRSIAIRSSSRPTW